jgi:nitrite reductase (NO-forming)
LSGEIVVNGETYNNTMPAQALTDQEVAEILTYVYDSWGNNKTVVTEGQVKAERH